ncbi:MAG: purine-nucleoside phosphorylase [Verrucomicrobiota bacterium]
MIATNTVHSKVGNAGHEPEPSGNSPSEAAAVLLRRSKLRPALGMILGTGFQQVLQRCTAILEVDYSSIPGFPRTGVAGHAGKLVLGYMQKTPVVILSGRSHYYEGHSLEQVTFGVRLLAAMGIRALVLTNAAGGINASLKPGDFMVLTDHINLMGVNPLRGPVPPGRHRFVDMTDAHNKTLRRMMREVAKEVDVNLHEGVYLAVSGPSYETPAEIRAFATLGADAVGMSTVPEIIVSRQCGMKIVAVSCITNLAAGRNPQPLSHSEVLETGKRSAGKAAALLENFARLYGQKKDHPK